MCGDHWHTLEGVQAMNVGQICRTSSGDIWGSWSSAAIADALSWELHTPHASSQTGQSLLLRSFAFMGWHGPFSPSCMFQRVFLAEFQILLNGDFVCVKHIPPAKMSTQIHSSQDIMNNLSWLESFLTSIPDYAVLRVTRSAWRNLLVWLIVTSLLPEIMRPSLGGLER